MRLIDADALQVWLVKMLNEFDDDNDPREIKREMFHCVLSKVRKMPIVAAAPVVHGRWIDVSCSGGLRECSMCHDWQIHYEKYFPKYCPNCGAKMDGEEQACGSDYCEIGVETND